MPENRKTYVQDVQRVESDRTGTTEFALIVSDRVNYIRSGCFPERVDVVQAGSGYRVLGCDADVRAYRQLGLNAIDARIWESEDEYRLARDGQSRPESTEENPCDQRGKPVPMRLRDAHAKFVGTLELLLRCDEIRQGLTGLREKRLLPPALSMEHLLSYLTRVEVVLRGVQPFAPCPRCVQLLNKNCIQCGGRGFVSKAEFEKLSSAELEVISPTSTVVDVSA